MTYQYYENKVWNKARVHISDCSFCNYGEGIHTDSSEENGQWSQPFQSLEEALHAAFRTGRKVSECKRCMTIPLDDLEVAV